MAGEEGERALDRLLLFSDAVVAIAITLLALDLPVPAGGTAHELWRSVRQEKGHYAAFVISFGSIAGMWSDHHRAFRNVVRVDDRMRSLDLAWLFLIVLNPFATKLLTLSGPQDHVAHALRFGFYALVQGVASAVLWLVIRHARGAGELAKSSEAEHALRLVERGTIVPALGFLVSIPIFFATTYGWIAWFAIPFAAGVRRRSLLGLAVTGGRRYRRSRGDAP